MSLVIGAAVLESPGAYRRPKHRGGTVRALVAVALLAFLLGEGSAAANVPMTAHAPEVSVATVTPDYVDFQVHAAADVEWQSTPWTGVLWSLEVEWADHPFVCDLDCPPGVMPPKSSGFLHRFDSDSSAEATVPARISRQDTGMTWYFRARWDVQTAGQYGWDVSPLTTAWVLPREPGHPVALPPPIEDPQKLVYKQAAFVFGGMAVILRATSWGVGLIPCGGCQLLGVALNGIGHAMGLAALPFGALAIDPPDPDYQSIAQPSLVPPVALPAAGRVPRGARRALARLYEQVGHTSAYLAAMLTAYERAQGAALANDFHWRQRQMTTAAAFGRRAARAARAMQRWAGRAAARLRNVKVARRQFTSKQLRAAARRWIEGRVPPAVVRVMERSGPVDPQTIRDTLSRFALRRRTSITGQLRRLAISPRISAAAAHIEGFAEELDSAATEPGTR